MNILAQVFGLFGILINMIGIQLRKKEQILISFFIASIFYSLCFLLLESYSGTIICIVSAIEILINYLYEIKNKKFPLSLVIIYLLVALLCGFLTYKTIIDILPVLGSLTFTLSIIQEKESNLRYITLLNVILWVVYNCLVGAYALAINDVFLIGTTVVAIIRYDVLKRTRKK